MTDEQGSETKRPWQGTLLGILLVFNVLAAAGLIYALFMMGRDGFKGGEMGIIVGFAGFAALLLAIPLFILMIFAVRAVFRGRRWGVVLALILTLLGFPPVFFTLGAGVASFLITLILWSLFLWLEIVCLKHPYYPKKTGSQPSGS